MGGNLSGLAGDHALAVVIDRQGWVWVGTHRGLSVLDADGHWTTYTEANSMLFHDIVDFLAIDGQGRVWAGAWNGLSVLDPAGAWTIYTAANSGLAHSQVSALTIDGQDRVWVGTSRPPFGGRGLSVIDPDGRWTTYTAANSGLADDEVDALSIDGQGRVWVGTDGGLSVLEMWMGMKRPIAPSQRRPVKGQPAFRFSASWAVFLT